MHDFWGFVEWPIQCSKFRHHFYSKYFDFQVLIYPAMVSRGLGPMEVKCAAYEWCPSKAI